MTVGVYRRSRTPVPTGWSVTVSEDVHVSHLGICSNGVGTDIFGWVYTVCSRVLLRVGLTTVVMITGKYVGSQTGE